MMTDTILARYADAIEAEYMRAITKHPKFANDWLALNPAAIEEKMTAMQRNNDMAEKYDIQCVDSILMEELLEVCNAAGKQDWNNLREELTQLIAVALRALEKLDKRASDEPCGDKDFDTAEKVMAREG